MRDIAAGLLIYSGFTLGLGALLLGIAHGIWWLAIVGLIACIGVSRLLHNPPTE